MCDVVMGRNRKALLAMSKALPEQTVPAYYQAMLSTSSDIAANIRAAMEDANVKPVDLAAKCGVSRQAVNGWLTTGRIHKKHLARVAEVTNTTIAALLSPPRAAHRYEAISASPTLANGNPPTLYALDDWPFRSFTKAEYAALVIEDRMMVEGFVRGLIAGNHTKSNGTHGKA